MPEQYPESEGKTAQQRRPLRHLALVQGAVLLIGLPFWRVVPLRGARVLTARRQCRWKGHDLSLRTAPWPDVA
jgi:hypothetical protein